MRLADFILANIEPILAEWDCFARSLTPGAKMTKLALRNDAEAILVSAARDMQVAQNLTQQASKSKGLGGGGGEQSDRLNSASELHGVQRVGSGFDIIEVVSEYRALRASVLRLWRESLPSPDQNDIDDITRFNESIDQSLAGAVGSFTKRVEQSRRMFLAILSHDLRNPLNTIRMAGQLVAQINRDPDAARALSMIDTHTQSITELVSDLIDFASTGLGSRIPLSRSQVDLGELCREVIDGFRSTHKGRELKLRRDGELKGNWDAGRMRQVVSNLVHNALQHGDGDGAVEVKLATDASNVILSVHNAGEPIPSEVLATIFDPLVRHAAPDSAAHRVPGSIGLGLYIVREIVAGHGGTIDIASTADVGTTFTVRLPRAA